MSDDLRARLKELAATWEDAAVWEAESGNIHQGQAFDQCADELREVLVWVSGATPQGRGAMSDKLNTPTIGSVWIAASGEQFGYVVTGDVLPNGDVPVHLIEFKDHRTIDAFKLSYRYKPYLLAALDPLAPPQEPAEAERAEALAQAGILLEALQASIEWELAPTVIAEIRRVVSLIRAALTTPAPQEPKP